jgi:hypothetical protein
MPLQVHQVQVMPAARHIELILLPATLLLLLLL